MSLHDNLLRKEVNEALTKPDVSASLHGVLGELKAGHNDQEWVDIVLQKGRGFSYDIFDASVFGRVWSSILAGGILHLKVRVGAFPVSDDQIEENIARLAKLPAPFETSMQFGKADQDGFLFWRRPIRLAKSERAGIVDRIELPGGGGAPIEVGYTTGSRTLMHFAEYGCLARWPYEQESLTLLWRHPNTALKRVECDPHS